MSDEMKRSSVSRCFIKMTSLCWWHRPKSIQLSVALSKSHLNSIFVRLIKIWNVGEWKNAAGSWLKECQETSAKSICLRQLKSINAKWHWMGCSAPVDPSQFLRCVFATERRNRRHICHMSFSFSAHDTHTKYKNFSNTFNELLIHKALYTHPKMFTRILYMEMTVHNPWPNGLFTV